MKTILKITLLLLFVGNYAFSQDCKTLRVGKFKLNDDSINLRCIIERTETQQTETNLNTGDSFTGSIDWIDECTYVFTYQKSSNDNPDYQAFIGKKMIVNITKIKGDNIYFDCEIEDIDFKMSYFMTRIN